MQNIPCLIHEDENSLLLRSISLKELEATNFILANGKSPGANDFTSDIFHHC